MKQSFNKIFQVFGYDYVIKISVFILALIFISLIELLSIGIIPIYVGALVEPDFFLEKINFLNQFFSEENSKDFIIIIGIALICVFLVKNVLIGIFTYIFNLYLKDLNLSLSSKLYSNYIHTNLEDIKSYNSNILTRNIINETS